MFRNPHVAFCSVRPLLLGARDPAGHAFPHACCRCSAGPPGGARAPSFPFHKDRGADGKEGGEPSAGKDKGAASCPVNLATNRLKAVDFFLSSPQGCLRPSNPKPFAFDAWGSKAAFKRQHNHRAVGGHGRSKATECRPTRQRQPDPGLHHHHHHHHPPSLGHVAVQSPRHFGSTSEQHGSRWSLNRLLQRSSRPPPPQHTQVRPLHRGAASAASAPPRLEAASLKDCLSAENEARCRQTLGPNRQLYEATAAGDAKDGKDRGGGRRKQASVLVSLCSVGERPAFLFTLRSNALKGRHKGDVSFAGGKSDQADKDVVDTALREAQEELGITVDQRQVWGVLKPLRDMSGMLIAPVLANLGPLEALSFKPNPQEVEEIFTLSLSHVCDPRNRGYTHFRTGDKYGYTLPVFRHGKHRVWGLTAVALDHTLNIIVPKS